MSVDEIKAMVRRFAEEPWSSGNLAVYDEVCSPDYVLHEMDGNVKNLETMKQGVKEARVETPDLTSRVNDIIVNGDHVAYGWTMRGTVNGERSKVVGMTFLRLKDGKIIDDSFVASDLIPEEELAAKI